MAAYRPANEFIGGYTPTDGTIEFYGRIKALARPGHKVLDLGAGRAEWFEDDECEYRRMTRLLKGHVSEVIAADVDKAVINNRASDRNLVFDGTIPLPDQSVDIIVADYVLEHVVDPEGFAADVRRLLKPGGLFCARTPHKYHYVSVGARMVKNQNHARFLERLQPDRKPEDVFPTVYRLNTLKDISTTFRDFEDYSYLIRSDPAYFGGRKPIYRLLEVVHHLTPSWFSGNLLVFLRRL